MTPPPDVTQLLNEIAKGDRRAEGDLVPLVYKELRALASRYMRGERGDHTLQTTALVHEAYLRLVKPREGMWQNRTHFFAVAATVMRHILVDYARARTSGKRGDALTIPFDDVDVAVPVADSARILALDEALDRLALLDERQAKIVELRFFAGMTVEETADALGMSPRTVKRQWQLAKSWLYGELTA